MARKFAEAEKERIRNRLLEQGRHWFGTYGFKKTSIGDVTKAVGIAQGTFYLFFPSKEELYLEILRLEEQAIRGRLLAEFLAGSELTAESFKQFLRRAFDVMETNPLLRQMYDEEVVSILFRKIPQAKLEELYADDARDLLPVIVRLQEQGEMKPHQPEVVLSLIRSIVLLSLHKKQIGEGIYDQTIDLLLDLVSRGLVTKEGTRRD
jgi:AcrR family transcriptional regulator